MIACDPIICFPIQTGVNSPVSDYWILSSNFWDNTGIWINAETWEGAPPGTVFGYDFISGYSDLIGSQPDALAGNADIVVGGVDIISNSDLSVSTYTELGVFNETPANSTVPCELGDLTSGSIVNGVQVSTNFLYFIGSTTAGKYLGDCTSDWAGAIISSNGFSVRVVINSGPSALVIERIGAISDAELQDNFEHGNELTIDWSRSNLTESEVDTLRTNAGDSTGGFPAAEQIDLVSDFEIGFLGQVALDSATNNQVLLDVGNIKIFTSTTQIIADIGGNQSALTKTLTSLDNWIYLKYNDGDVSIVVGGDESTPVSAGATTSGSYIQVGADTSRSNQAQGVYSGLYFRNIP